MVEVTIRMMLEVSKPRVTLTLHMVALDNDDLLVKVNSA